MSSPLEQLRIMRDELRKQLNANELFLAWVAADKAVREVEKSICGSSKFGNRVTNVLAGHQERIPDLAIAMIREQGIPLSTTQIFGRLLDAGAKFDGASPIKNLRTALSKDLRLRSIHWKSDRAWWLSELPRPHDDSKQDPL